MNEPIQSIEGERLYSAKEAEEILFRRWQESDPDFTREDMEQFFIESCDKIRYERCRKVVPDFDNLNEEMKEIITDLIGRRE